MADIARYILSPIRLLSGASAILMPISTAKFFLLEATASSTIFIRLLGSRDFILGGLLWTADDEKSTRLALIAGAICDAIDILGVGLCFVEGSLSTTHVALFVGIGVPVILLALWALQQPGAAKKVS